MKRIRCADESSHRSRRAAEAETELWLLDCQQRYGLTDIEMLQVLASATDAFLRHLARDDEERRTGFRHRLAGE